MKRISLFLATLFVAPLVVFSTATKADLILSEGDATGQWYNPTRNGEGFFVEIIAGEPQQISIAMYSFDNEGNPLWAAGNVPITSDQQTVEIPLFLFDGPMWGSAYDPADLNQTPFATVTARFPSCDTAAFSVATESEEFESGSYSLLRLTDIEGIECIDPPTAPEAVTPGKWEGSGVCLNVSQDGKSVTIDGSTCENGASWTGDSDGLTDVPAGCDFTVACAGTHPIAEDGTWACGLVGGIGLVEGTFRSDISLTGSLIVSGVAEDFCVINWSAAPAAE